MFIANKSEAYGCVATNWNAALSFENCTFYGNFAGTVIVAGAGEGSSATLDLQRCIFAFNDGYSVFFEQAGGTNLLNVTCSDIFGNSGGDWVGNLAGQDSLNGNFAADPLFCDTLRRHLQLTAGSPCLPSGNSCAVLIGANGAGCPPVPAFGFSPDTGVIPLAVQFTESSLYSPISWKWSFGDGDSSSVQNPSHTYSAVGNYFPQLTVCNAYGCATIVSARPIVVTDGIPISDFTFAPDSGLIPLTVNFSDLSSILPHPGDGCLGTVTVPLPRIHHITMLPRAIITPS